ncbi:myb-like protein A [Eurosta solidaginis]|uniref:myb-like protein A n=1 Tax=Eurosta solidaginis TaxID=178769 RepID=UPI003530A9E0
MPVGNQLTSRPYSSFRATRGSCSTQYCQGNNNNATAISNSSCNHNHNNNNNSNSYNNNKNGALLNGHNSSTSSYSSQTNNINNNLNSYNNNNNNNYNNKSNDNHFQVNCQNNNSFQGNNFGRQQPLRSSFYGTRYHGGAANNNNVAHLNNGDSNNNVTDKRYSNAVPTTSIKPLTPKLVRRIETTCGANGICGGGSGGSCVSSQSHTKARAPQPPVPASAVNFSSVNKQYLRTRNQPPPPPPPPSARNATHFERFQNNNLSFRHKNASGSTVASANKQSPALNGDEPKYPGATFYNSNTRTSGGQIGSQKRAYCTAAQKLGQKENVPARSVKNYPAPLPPTHTPKAVTKKKYKEDMLSVSASPNLNNRRFAGAVSNDLNKPLSASQRRKNYVPFNGQLNNNAVVTAAAAAAAKNGSTGSNASTGSGSSNSHGSPKTKKVFSTKFPQGLPFEDEFYRNQYHRRSYSQSSSSNYSFYSSVGASAMPRSRDFDDVVERHQDAVTAHERRSTIDEDDEFQRKPASDEPLYVDFSKVMQRQPKDISNVHFHRNSAHYCSSSSSGATLTTIVPTTTWIGTKTRTTHSPLPTALAAKLASENGSLDSYAAAAASAAAASSPAGCVSPNLRRTTRSKISHSINDYLFTSCGTTKATTATPTTPTTYKKMHGKLLLSDDPEDVYYTHTSPELPPQTDIYLAVASWAPKCLHPAKVHIPASDSRIADMNNNPTPMSSHAMINGYDHRSYYGKMASTNATDILEPTTNEYK